MINFYQCRNLDETKEFYLKLGLTISRIDPQCIIFDSGYGEIGFLESSSFSPLPYSCISFVKETKEEVDKLHQQFLDFAISSPKQHEKYPVYSFFMKDPNHLTVEFQVFT
ncbi:MAG: VOC family protein [Anaerorhabdus sp.]|uniref:VOC family protein n=1 Tax=Anaerorhabdus sp. TaxID=1872524 RepID=UPI002FC59D4C